MDMVFFANLRAKFEVEMIINTSKDTRALRVPGPARQNSATILLCNLPTHPHTHTHTLTFENSVLVSEYTQLELPNANLIQDLKAAANLNRKSQSPIPAEAPGASQEELHLALQKASQEKDELLAQMAKEKQDLIEHTKTLEEAHSRIVEEAQLATMRLAAEKQSLEELNRQLAEEKVAAERDQERVAEVERERERAEERFSGREAEATFHKLPLAPTASTTVEELTAELEGALHIKEQEAIIAEVRSSGFECYSFVPRTQQRWLQLSPARALALRLRARALAAPRWACPETAVSCADEEVHHPCRAPRTVREAVQRHLGNFVRRSPVSSDYDVLGHFT